LTVRVSFETEADVSAAAGLAVARPTASIAAAPVASPSRRALSVLFMISSSQLRLPTLGVSAVGREYGHTASFGSRAPV
jgi:hypothetical protein